MLALKAEILNENYIPALQNLWRSLQSCGYETSNKALQQIAIVKLLQLMKMESSHR